MGYKQLFIQKLVTTAGTPVQIVLPVNEITGRYIAIQAKHTNTGKIILGDAASILLGIGHTINAEDYYILDLQDYSDFRSELSFSEIWIDADVSGEGVVISYPYSDDKQQSQT